MQKYLIEVDDEMATLIKKESITRKLTVQELITQILNRYLIATHTIDKDEMAKGYEETAEINLELANL